MPVRRDEAGYLDFLSRAKSAAAHKLINMVSAAVVSAEKRGKARSLREATAFKEAIERIVGDLLRAYADSKNATPDAETDKVPSPRRFRAITVKQFTGERVSYRNFVTAVEALSSLGFIRRFKGVPRYRKIPEMGPHADDRLKGTASRFEARSRLVNLALDTGVDLTEFDQHFRMDPPLRPLVLNSSIGRWGQRRATRVEFKHTQRTRALEAAVVSINDYLARCEFSGGAHYGYYRVFNEGRSPNHNWQKGGRLYSIGARNYQQLPGAERALMMINGEPVVEIDVRASNLTILHACLGEPFDVTRDPYAEVGLDRGLVKLWTIISMANGNPAGRWPRSTANDYLKEHGKALVEVCKANTIRSRMLDAFPALRRLRDAGAPSPTDMMFIESGATIGTMIRLMHDGVPALSVHDSIIVPFSSLEKATEVFHETYKARVGVSPWLGTKSELKGAKSIVESISRSRL